MQILMPGILIRRCFQLLIVVTLKLHECCNNGANPNREYTLAGTPLFAAVNEGHADMVNLLLSRGADFRIRIGDETVLQIARKRKDQAVIDLLEAAGAKE